MQYIIADSYGGYLTVERGRKILMLAIDPKDEVDLAKGVPSGTELRIVAEFSLDQSGQVCMYASGMNPGANAFRSPN